MQGISLAVLAGGQSTRFGSNKALTEVDGRPIIQRVIDAARDLVDEAFIVTNTTEDFGRFGLRMVPDVLPAGGALRGLHTALSTARGPWVLCLACDMPFPRKRLLQRLCEVALMPSAAPLGGVAPRHAGGVEPLCAIYQRDVCLPLFAPLFEAGRFRLSGIYEQAPMRFIEPPELDELDPGLLSFVNVNTRSDLEAAAVLARERDL